MYEMAAKVLKTSEVQLMSFCANTKFRFSKPPLHKYPNRYRQFQKNSVNERKILHFNIYFIFFKFIGIKIKCQKKIDKKTAKTPINKEFRAK